MNKKFTIGIAIIIILSIFYLVFGGTSSKKKSASNSNLEIQEDKSVRENMYSSGGDPSGHWNEALSPFLGEEKRGYLELIEELKTGKSIFGWEVWALRRKCPTDYTPSQCDETIYKFLDTHYTSPDKEKMKELFKAYFQFENEARQMEFPSGISFEEKYEILKKRRRESVGQEKAELFFGLEEAQVTFIAASHNFIESSKNLSGKERVQKYEDLRKKTYGSYLDTVSKREDNFEHYKTETMLLEKDLAALNPEEKEKKLYSIQVKYFGKEGADRIAQSNKEMQAHDKKISDYEKLEQDFLASHKGISEKDKEQKLTELRTKHLGQEGAENYRLTKQYEADINKIQ